MRVSIAGITCEVEGLEGWALGALADQRFAAFLSSDPADFTARLAVREPIRKTDVDLEQPMVVMEKLDDDVLSVCRVDNPFEATIDFAQRIADVDLNENLYCLDSFMRILYSILLARDGGLLLHSAAVSSEGRGSLMVGVSEAGKTTLCRQGFETVLSDELVAIRRTAEGFRAFGTPFWGEFVAGPVCEEADVAALYLLRKGPRYEVRPVAVGRAVMEVLGCVFFFGPSELSPSVLELAGDLVESRLRGEFYCRPEPGVVPFLDEELSRNAS